MKVDRLKIYNMFDGHCAYCGKKIALKDMQIDHVVPIFRGCTDRYSVAHRGTDTEDNMMPACRSCNFRKSTSTLEHFRENLIKQRDDLVKRSFQMRQSIDYGLVQVINKPIVFYFEQQQEQP